MKALSLTQPWATLIAIGAKRIETRSWSTPFRERIAIHASKGFPRDCRELCREEPFRSALERGGIPFDASAPAHWYHVPSYRLREIKDMPLGAIVALATITGVARTENIIAMSQGLLRHEIDFGDYSPGRFGWVLADVVRLPKPIPAKGALGLWSVTPEILEQIEFEEAQS